MFCPFSVEGISQWLFLLLYGTDVHQNNLAAIVFPIVELGAWSLAGMGERWRKEVNPSVEQIKNTL